MPMHRLPDGGLLVLPRVLARTVVEVRRVVELPEGMALVDEGQADAPSSDPRTDENHRFWTEFLARLVLDDPDQPRPTSIRQGYCNLILPVPQGDAWLTIYRNAGRGRLGVYLSWWRGSSGERAASRVIADWSDSMATALGSDARLGERADGTPTLIAKRDFGDLSDPARRDVGFDWLAKTTNAFVNVLRPAIRAAARDLEDSAE